MAALHEGDVYFNVDGCDAVGLKIGGGGRDEPSLSFGVADAKTSDVFILDEGRRVQINLGPICPISAKMLLEFFIECYLQMVQSKQALISFELFVNLSSFDDEAHLHPSDNYD